MSPYYYKSLPSPKSIRLVRFAATIEPDEQLKCSLEAVSLDSNPDFQALSYTWGGSIFPCSLTCDSQTIRITQNLCDALVHFRQSGQELTIWIDAICIDQSNVDEKSQQIPLMAEIYRKASNVLIWLGPESDGSKEAMQYLERIGKRFLDRGGPVREPKVELNDDHGAKNKVLWEDVWGDKDIMKRTDTIWMRPWFSRRWVIQEVVFSQRATVHYGMEQVEWAVFAKAAEVLAILDGDGSQFINRRTGVVSGLVCQHLHNATKLERFRKEFWAGDPKPTARQHHDCLDRGINCKECRDRLFWLFGARHIHHWLDYARGFDCTEDKDRVFALLGIITYGGHRPFTISYLAPAAAVFEAFARYCIQETASLEILTFAGLSNHGLCGESLQLPSWVPDWRLPFRSPNDRLRGFAPGVNFNFAIGLNDSAAELSAEGRLVDRIIGVMPSIGYMEKKFPVGEVLQEANVFKPGHIAVWYQTLDELARASFWMNKVDMSTAEYVAGGESILKALGRTLVLDYQDVSFDMKPHRDPFVQKADVPQGYPAPKLTDEFFGFRYLMFTTYGEFENCVTLQDGAGQPIEVPKPNYSAVQRQSRQGEKVTTWIDYEYMEYFTRLVDRCQNRAFFVTQKGYIGLGPEDIQRDDIVCVFNELSVPSVLRPQNKDFNIHQISGGDVLTKDPTACSEKFQFLGECYTHGLMSYEAFNMRDLQTEKLTLI